MLFYVSAFLPRRKAFPADGSQLPFARETRAASLALPMHPVLSRLADSEDAAMKTLSALVLCAVLLLTSSDGWAKKHRSKRIASDRPHKSKVIRTRTRTRRRPPATLAEQSDEIILSPNLLRKLQANLVDGGYLTGTLDGRLTRRTRRALAEFQREYHMPGTGALDRATAEALLGHDLISTFLVAQSAD